MSLFRKKHAKSPSSTPRKARRCGSPRMEMLESRVLLSGAGQLDPTFGQGGQMRVNFGVEAYTAQVALQSDGKIIAVGGTKTSSTPDGDDWSIARVNANGTLDTSFANGGKIIMNWDGGYDEAFSVAVQSDGKILVAGDVTIGGNQNAAVIRLNSNGTLDTSFANGGKLIVDFYNTPHNYYRTSDTFRQIRIDSQGRIVLAGSASSANGDRMAVVRLNSNGSFDSSFGNGGQVVLSSLANQSSGQTEGMIIQSDGRIVLVGLTSQNGANYDYSIVRLNSNGSLDSAGGSGGFAHYDWYGDWDIAWGVAQQTDGKLVVTGEVIKGGEFAIGTLRLNSDLTLDSSFGSSGGKVLLDYNPTQDDVGRDVAIQTDGKIVVVGRLFNSTSDAGVIRYNSNGTLDTSFGNGGTATFDLNGYFDSAEGLAFQPDGKIVVAGEEQYGGKINFGVLRFLAQSDSTPIVPADPNAVYLSGLSPVSATNGWGPYEKDMSNGESAAGDGHTISLRGVTYAKGLGVHANSQLVFNLNGAYTNFSADVGVDDEVNGQGSVDFQVWADGVKLYDSGIVTGTSAAKSVSVDLTGRQQLILKVTDGGDNFFFDHSDWANARLTEATTPPPPPPPGDNIVYLSSLSPVSATNGWGPYEKDMSNGESAAGDGHTISLRGVTYAKGLGVHANSQLVFNLNGAYTNFSADVGVDDEVNGQGSVDFQVWADGVKLYDSGIVTGTSAAKSVSVDLTGRQQLTLKVTDGGDNFFFDHSDWANARLTKATTPPPPNNTVYLSNLTPTSTTNGYGPYEKDMSNGEDGAGDGHTLSLRGVTYAKGLGVHAYSQLVFNLGGTYSQFMSTIGIDDEVSGRGSVVFQILAGNTKIYDSGLLTGASAAQNVSLNVSGVQQLTLIVNDGGDNFDFDHADWANARLLT